MLEADGDAPVLLRRSTAQPIDPGYVSMTQPIAYATTDGLTAHAFFYPPRNRDFVGQADAKAPLIVKSHRGPTSQARAEFSLKTDRKRVVEGQSGVVRVALGGRRRNKKNK